ncbi:MAG: carbohydrate ABC transporter permease, partial [Lachnospiraceae bacterium]
MKKSNISMKVIAYTFLIIMAIIFVMPMLFTIISSLKTKLDIFSDPFALPKNPQWSNYVIAWKDANMSAYFINSVIQSGSTVILTSLISTMAAYALARFDFKLNKVLVLVFMLGMMVPMHTILVPVSY